MDQRLGDTAMSATKITDAAQLKGLTFEEEYRRGALNRSYLKIAAGLRSLAEQMEREADRYNAPDADQDIYRLEKLAYGAVHDVTWGVANLDLGGLARDAAEYAAARMSLATAKRYTPAANIPS
jgi:hypothetical protein